MLFQTFIVLNVSLLPPGTLYFIYLFFCCVWDSIAMRRLLLFVSLYYLIVQHFGQLWLFFAL